MNEKHPEQRPDVLVIGGGIVGMSTAYELARQGARVTVVDKGEIGMACSYGNAGWVTPCFAMPLPMPGMLMKSIRWLMDPVSPLYIKPQPHFLLLKWLGRFLLSMNEEQALASIRSLTEISNYSFERYSKLSQETGVDIEFEQKGLLMVSQTDEGVQLATEEMDLVARHGVPGKKLSPAEIQALEPALTKPLRGGVYFPKEAHVEPLKAVRAFQAGAERHGARILPQTEVFDFEYTGSKISKVKATLGDFYPDTVVMATGAWSLGLARRLQISAPILGGKGYAWIVKPFDPSPKIPIMVVERKLAITPRKDSVRLAGTLELVNMDFSITPRRAQALLDGSRAVMNVPEKPEVLELWRGLRPCTPDGVPMVGYSEKVPNLFMACGHQMLGLQSAPGSARLAADLILGKDTIFDPRPFNPNRF